MKKAEVKGVIVSDDEKWIYDYYGRKSCSPADVNKVLDDARGEDITVEINSGGGDLFAGSEIYSALERYSGRVITDVTGLAASAASVVAMAGDECRMSRTAAMMIHNVSCETYGDHREMERNAEVLKTLNKSVAAAYRRKTGREDSELLEMMNKETWLDAQRAVELGLADSIYGDESTAPKGRALFAAAQGGLLPRALIETMTARRARAVAKLNLLKTTRRRRNDV